MQLRKLSKLNKFELYTQTPRDSEVREIQIEICLQQILNYSNFRFVPNHITIYSYHVRRMGSKECSREISNQLN